MEQLIVYLVRNVCSHIDHTSHYQEYTVERRFINLEKLHELWYMVYGICNLTNTVN